MDGWRTVANRCCNEDANPDSDTPTNGRSFINLKFNVKDSDGKHGGVSPNLHILRSLFIYLFFKRGLRYGYVWRSETRELTTDTEGQPHCSWSLRSCCLVCESAVSQRLTVF